MISNYSKNVQMILDVLKNEVDGDVSAALQKMSADYQMTWMYQKGSEFFPKTTNHVSAELEDVYPMKGRVYDVRNIAESDNVVMVEMIESYPDSETGKIYRTLLVIILEIEGGKIRTARHYCDPRLSFADLTEEQIEDVLSRTPRKFLIS